MASGDVGAYVLGKMGAPQRGPSHGDGRGPGEPWAGLVEDTPALWVTWIVEAVKRLGGRLPVELSIAGRPLRMASTELTFGTRWYWLCPECGRRCEAIYIAGRAACRRCLRLGYNSQTQRATSVWAFLDMLFDRDGPRPRYQVDQGMTRQIMALLGRHMQGRIDRLFDQVEVMHDGQNTTSGT